MFPFCPVKTQLTERKFEDWMKKFASILKWRRQTVLCVLYYFLKCNSQKTIGPTIKLVKFEYGKKKTWMFVSFFLPHNNHTNKKTAAIRKDNFAPDEETNNCKPLPVAWVRESGISRHTSKLHMLPA